MSGKSTGIKAAGRWSILRPKSHIEETLTPVNANVHMPTSWKEIKTQHPGGPLPPPRLLKTNAALSAALGGCRRARSSGTFYLVPASTYSETRALFLVPFKCVRAASPEKTSPSLSIWLFPLITLSPSAGGGLSKQQKHQNFYVLFGCGGENGGGGGGGVRVQLKVMRVEGCSGGAAVPHVERPVRRVHLHLSEASQPGSLSVNILPHVQRSRRSEGERPRWQSHLQNNRKTPAEQTSRRKEFH